MSAVATGMSAHHGMTPAQGALSLAEEFSLPVFPCGPDKKPRTTSGFKDASRNIEQIGEWFDLHDDVLVAVPTGRASNLLVVDIDPIGSSWYAENQGRLGAGRVHKTRRGHHLLYKMPGAEIRNSAGKLAPGVDVRAEGGYIIWWPAHGLEAIGDLSDLTEPPAWLIDALSARVEPKVIPLNGSAHPEGGRNDALTRLGGKLRRDGLNDVELEAALLAANHQRCNPPLADEEVRGVAKSVARYEPAKEPDAPVIPQLPSRSPLDWCALQEQIPPPREWALNQWLPQGHPSLLPGRGGIGKTLLAQCLGTAMALGRDYIDEIERPLRILFWAGEDDQAELWRRQLKICQHFGVELSALKDRLFIQSYEGADLTLAGTAFGQLAPTMMLEELRQQVNDYRADYVFMDNVARVYGGNENDRHQATQFLAWLSSACAPAGVCLLGHPAKGVGSEYSGSTAWEGAVRARLYLSDRLPDAQDRDDDAPPDEKVRYLSRRKSNYSPNDWRRFELRDGVLVPEQHQFVAAADISGEFAKDIVRRAVRKLKDMGFHGNAGTRSPEYLPKLSNQYGLLDRLSEKRFGGIMRDLIKEGELTVATVGRYSNRSPKTGLVLK